jgi:hypothetical protein
MLTSRQPNGSHLLGLAQRLMWSANIGRAAASCRHHVEVDLQVMDRQHDGNAPPGPGFQHPGQAWYDSSVHRHGVRWRTLRPSPLGRQPPWLRHRRCGQGRRTVAPSRLAPSDWQVVGLPAHSPQVADDAAAQRPAPRVPPATGGHSRWPRLRMGDLSSPDRPVLALARQPVWWPGTRVLRRQDRAITNRQWTGGFSGWSCFDHLNPALRVTISLR